MRGVLLLIKSLGEGGAERALIGLASQVDRTRFRYEVAYLDPRMSQWVPEFEQLGLPVHCLDAGLGPGWLARLRRLVRERGVDLVHAQSPVPAVGARLLSVAGGPPVVYTEQTNWGAYHPLTRVANMLTFGLNTEVFSVSAEASRSMRYPRPLRWLPMPRVEVVPNGVDLAQVESWEAAGAEARALLGLPAGAPVVGTVSNLRPEKGHSFLIDAVDLIRGEFPGLKVVVVGWGPHEQEVRDMVRRRGLEDTVRLVGAHDEAARLIGAFDVFVLPSLHEGMPVALLEAMALARPLVVTDAGGVPEVVRDGSEAIVVPRGDPEALANGIRTLLRDRALSATLGAAARVRAQRFDVRPGAARMEEVYAAVLASTDGVSA